MKQYSRKLFKENDVIFEELFTCRTPTAGDDMDKILGLEYGADDT